MKFQEAPPPLYEKLFKNNFRTFTIKEESLFPLADVQWKKAYTFNNKVCNFTKEGRNLIYVKLNDSIANEIRKLLQISNQNELMEYADNCISKYSAQRGKCAITQWFLSAEEIHCHFIIPISCGGTNKFRNLMIVHKDINTLIYATSEEIIAKLLEKFNLNKKQLDKLNQLRKKCNLTKIN